MFRRTKLRKLPPPENRTLAVSCLHVFNKHVNLFPDFKSEGQRQPSNERYETRGTSNRLCQLKNDILWIGVIKPKVYYRLNPDFFKYALS